MLKPSPSSAFTSILLMCSLLTSGCLASGKEPPPELADDDTIAAAAVGLGDEYEVTQRIQLVEDPPVYSMKTSRPYSSHHHLVGGYLEPGTRLRVVHVWRLGKDPSGWGGIFPTLRVVPNHDPWLYPLRPSYGILGGTPDGQVVHLDKLDPRYVRRVEPEERTPNHTIEKLDRKQEWPKWRWE